MTYLLDTNVVSELRKPPHRAAPTVRAWADSQPASEFWISVITVLEIEIGVARMERRDPRQGAVLRRWLDRHVLGAFEDRVVPVDLAAVRRAATLHVPDPRPERDVLIAASAGSRNFVVVTRNTGDFRELGVILLNPWLVPERRPDT